MINQIYIFFSLLLLISLLFFGIFLAKIKNSGNRKRQLIFYLIIIGLLIGLISFKGFIEFNLLPLWIFILANVWGLTIGVLHNWLFQKIIPQEINNQGKLLFSLSACFFGYALIFLSFMLFIKTPFPWVYFSPAFFILAPTFVLIAFHHYIRIPVKIFKEWHFPTPGTLSDPSDSEMHNLIIVNFEIRKQPTEGRTVFKARAPIGLTLGRLFYFFILDYNSRYPDNPILIKEDESNYFKWSFHMIPSFFTGKIHLDPELSISENRIHENASVTCERLLS